ncbi:polypyrimidine tract-binding protein homolog 1-like isoform X2 [Rhododendron vialii]|uniref:polypyrimidine tract-binding protein homolog 1-like isoform X2 n=1 Tax=Rhododendron vialii TaxID=182163 RepID=UPI00265F7F8F|nr:polypyrimidine tract-binding protein homolog 1-like isoform X2 [Rhododendron vialii]
MSVPIATRHLLNSFDTAYIASYTMLGTWLVNMVSELWLREVDLNQAINMVTYYASSSEPAQVRGKHVYIQYSNRHEIVNNAKGPGDVPGNVLLVTIEGVEAGDVSIDVIHLVFSAFGFVHKIATFEKAAGFQALIQFSDIDTAASAREALDGRSIPRYLLPDHVSSCHLRISYSAHTDLNIKFQSHRSRDYTNPYLPVNSTAIEGFVQPAVGPDGKIKEPESNVLLASIGNMQYAVTVDVLHTVFATFGTVQKIAIFEKNGGTQALIQYPDVSTAAVAKEALEGHCIYDGGSCKLHLSYSRHTDLNVKAYCDKSRDYTVPESSLSNGWQNPQVSPMFSGNQFSGGGIASAAQPPMGQGPSWDPNIQAGRPTFVSAPGTFPGQTYAPSSVPAYASASAPPGSSPTMQTGQIGPIVGPRGVSQPSHQPNAGPGGTSRPGQPSYYG